MKKLRTKEPQIGILFLHISSMQNDIFALHLHHQGVVPIVATEYVHVYDVAVMFGPLLTSPEGGTPSGAFFE